MKPTYWHTQTGDKPLFENLLWSRPENRAHAGKLLIIGGNAHGFSAVAEAYQEALNAGIGVAQVLLPEAIQKIVGGFFENAYFTPSTPSGSFSTKSLGEWIPHAAWADGVLIAGDLGRNSETAIVLEKFLDKHAGQVTLTKDAVDYFKDSPKLVLDRADTTLALSFAQLQKLAANSGFTKPFQFSMPLMQLVEALHEFTKQHPINIIVRHLDYLAVASDGKVSTTQLGNDMEKWRVKAATHASVWWLQNPSKAFESLTTAVHQLQK